MTLLWLFLMYDTNMKSQIKPKVLN